MAAGYLYDEVPLFGSQFEYTYIRSVPIPEVQEFSQ
jgi:hypothetical protein